MLCLLYIYWGVSPFSLVLLSCLAASHPDPTGSPLETLSLTNSLSGSQILLFWCGFPCVTNLRMCEEDLDFWIVDTGFWLFELSFVTFCFCSSFHEQHCSGRFSLCVCVCHYIVLVQTTYLIYPPLSVCLFSDTRQHFVTNHLNATISPHHQGLRHPVLPIHFIVSELTKLTGGVCSFLGSVKKLNLTEQLGQNGSIWHLAQANTGWRSPFQTFNPG